MKTLHMKNDTRIQTKPTNKSRKRLSLGNMGPLDLSRTTNPRPPMVKRKLDARPSMMYWPFTRYGMKATYTEKFGEKE